MGEARLRLSGVQIRRSVEAAGGLWTQHDIRRITGYSTTWIDLLTNRLDFAKPVTYLKIHGREEAVFAGEDVVDFFEATERWSAAEKMYEAVQTLKRDLLTADRRRKEKHDHRYRNHKDHADNQRKRAEKRNSNADGKSEGATRSATGHSLAGEGAGT